MWSRAKSNFLNTLFAMKMELILSVNAGYP